MFEFKNLTAPVRRTGAVRSLRSCASIAVPELVLDAGIDVAIRPVFPFSANSTDDSRDVRAVETVIDSGLAEWHLVVSAICATIGS